MKWNAYIVKRETPFDGYDCMGTPIGELTATIAWGLRSANC